MKKFLLIVSSIGIAFFLFIWLSQSHFSVASAIPWDIKVLQSEDTPDGKAILFEDNQDHSFGVALVDRKFGFLYQYYIGTNGYHLDPGKPFQASGLTDDKHFIVGIKTAEDSNIKYITLGNHLDEVAPSETYDLTLKEVRNHEEEYYITEVKDHYAFFVIDEYTDSTWTIRGFDGNGNLIADKLFGAEERFVNR
ncbi:hypothetical protein [Salirhabdus sp. Marseille-P4669]|uniref:hypothetical protein n=1 Tax=Salirhabdus sp. Marseille-P4669 TaxID=2042310 RepID=UPI000C7C3BCC|nr:hypothetical protein [Salirhabdus sp. Marseille-P4669]